MSAFFNSLKSDLFDRRLMPVLALLGAALLAAIVYAVVGGSSSPAAPVASEPAPVVKSAGIAVSALATTNASVAETTSGAARQTDGSSRNPFKPIPGVKSASASAAATVSGAAETPAEGSSSTAGSSGESSSGSESSGAENNASSQGGTHPGKKKATKPGKAYKVSVLFGTAPAGTAALSAGLTPYEDLKRQQPLPSTTQPLVVFRGVIAGGKSATFTLVGEAILRGSAACLPSASQCQAIDLKVGETEELEYVPLGGTAVTYELQVVKIEPIKAKGAKAAGAASTASGFGGESKAGLKFLRKSGLLALPGLRYSTDGSVLVFLGRRHAFAARTRASAWASAFRG